MLAVLHILSGGFLLRKANVNMKLGICGKLEHEKMPRDKGYNVFAVTFVGTSLRGTLAFKSKFLEMGMWEVSPTASLHCVALCGRMGALVAFSVASRVRSH